MPWQKLNLDLKKMPRNSIKTWRRRHCNNSIKPNEDAITIVQSRPEDAVAIIQSRPAEDASAVTES